MVVIPAGEFMMGAADGEGNDTERPRHKVTIAKPFAVSKFEVMGGEFQHCVADNVCPATEDYFTAGGRPATHMSWTEADQFAQWLSKKTGKTYRLLSEAEWEYAARAGTTTAYSWGNEIGKGNANCKECGSEWDGKGKAPHRLVQAECVRPLRYARQRRGVGRRPRPQQLRRCAGGRQRLARRRRSVAG